MRSGQVPHVAVADRPGDARQAGYGHCDRGAHSRVSPARGRSGRLPDSLKASAGAVHRATFLARDLRKRIGSGLPATSTSRFAWWYVRPTKVS